MLLFLNWSIWLRNEYLCLCTYYNFKSAAADDADDADEDDDDDNNDDDDDDDDDDDVDDDDGDGGKYISIELHMMIKSHLCQLMITYFLVLSVLL